MHKPATLDIYIDFKSAASYLALKPTLALVTKLDLTAAWHPIRSPMQRIPKPQPEETRGETHRRIRANARMQTHLMYAQLQELPMRFRDEPYEADLALAVLRQLRSDPTPFIQRAFNAYWVDQADLNDATTVRSLVNELGMEQIILDEAAIEQLNTDISAAQENGIIDAPAYLIQDQLFIGREHFPWIEEILRTAG